MSRPIQFLLEHQQTVMDAFYNNDRQSKKTWKNLSEILPILVNTMSFNTFKQYLSVLVMISPELDKVRQEKNELVKQLDKTAQQKSELEHQVKTLEARFNKNVRQNSLNKSVRQKTCYAAKRVLGWSVQHGKDGYYRCFRKINNQVHCIYIGKKVVLKAVKLKIREKEKTLNV